MTLASRVVLRTFGIHYQSLYITKLLINVEAKLNLKQLEVWPIGSHTILNSDCRIPVSAVKTTGHQEMTEEIHLKPLDLRQVLWSHRQEFNDVDIICDDGKTKFSAHKIILASVSEFFKSELKAKNEIHLDASVEECQKLLQLIYLGKTTVNKSDSAHFLKDVAEKYKIEGILDESSSSVLENKDTIEGSDKEENPTPKLDDLPPEIMMKIFSHLRTQDLLVNVAPVSKYFYELVRDPEAHIKVWLPVNVDLGAASEFLRTATKIQELRIFTHEATRLELRTRPFSDEIEPQLFCDPLLIAVSRHSNLKVVDIDGLHATGKKQISYL